MTRWATPRFIQPRRSAVYDKLTYTEEALERDEEPPAAPAWPLEATSLGLPGRSSETIEDAHGQVSVQGRARGHAVDEPEPELMAGGSQTAVAPSARMVNSMAKKAERKARKAADAAAVLRGESDRQQRPLQDSEQQRQQQQPNQDQHLLLPESSNVDVVKEPESEHHSSSGLPVFDISIAIDDSGCIGDDMGFDWAETASGQASGRPSPSGSESVDRWPEWRDDDELAQGLPDSPSKDSVAHRCSGEVVPEDRLRLFSGGGQWCVVAGADQWSTANVGLWNAPSRTGMVVLAGDDASDDESDAWNRCWDFRQ